MTYTLVVYFALSGALYVEARHLTLQACAGQASINRSLFMNDLPKLNKRIGDVHWRCVPERLTTSTITDEHGIGVSK